MIFNNESIHSLPIPKSRKVYWDNNNPGFGIRMAPTGLKTFVFMYRFDGKCQMLTIGRLPETKLEKALAQISVFKNALKAGIDPKLLLSKSFTHQTSPKIIKAPKKILSHDEIAEFWNAINTLNLSIHIKTALQLVLFFGRTKSNILQTQWDHLDLETQTWVIPKNIKNNLQIEVIPLLEYGSVLFQELPRISQWVFPSVRNGGHLSEASIDQAIRQIRLSSNILALTVSNIRRTVGSGMISAGFHPYIVKEILGFKAPKRFSFIEMEPLDHLNLSPGTESSDKTKVSDTKINAYLWWHDYLSKTLITYSENDLISNSARFLNV